MGKWAAVSNEAAITIDDYGRRNSIRRLVKELRREILLAFWKVHILHHAAKGPIHGQWMLDELRHHGYEISPGTLYPLLLRMERLGWLRGKSDPAGGKRARKDYRLTPEGHKVLAAVQVALGELKGEVGVKKGSRRK